MTVTITERKEAQDQSEATETIQVQTDSPLEPPAADPSAPVAPAPVAATEPPPAPIQAPTPIPEAKTKLSDPGSQVILAEILRAGGMSQEATARIMRAVVSEDAAASAPKAAYFPGQQILATEQLPPGWIAVHFEGGGCEAHMRAPDNSDPEMRTKILRNVDAAYVACLPKPEERDPVALSRAPKYLLVNKRWRELFAHVNMWGDTVAIILVKDDDTRLGTINGTTAASSPRFMFIPGE